MGAGIEEIAKEIVELPRHQRLALVRLLDPDRPGKFLSEAKSELFDAVAYYEGEVTDLGRRLWDVDSRRAAADASRSFQRSTIDRKGDRLTGHSVSASQEALPMVSVGASKIA